MRVPKGFPVRPLKPGEPAKDRVACGVCGRSWDDAVPTAYTPAPSARCPFEEFHPVNKNAEAWRQARASTVDWQEEVIRLTKLVNKQKADITNLKEHVEMLQKMVASYQADNEVDYKSKEQWSAHD